MSNTVKKLLDLDHASKQARRTLRTAQADATKDTATATFRRAEEERADLLAGATDAEFQEYIDARNR